VLGQREQAYPGGSGALVLSGGGARGAYEGSGSKDCDAAVPSPNDAAYALGMADAAKGCQRYAVCRRPRHYVTNVNDDSLFKLR
jgi:hypothetical protein